MKARKMIFVLIPIIVMGIIFLIPFKGEKPPQRDKIITVLKAVPIGSMILYKNTWNLITNTKKDIDGNVCEITISCEFGKRLKENDWVYIDSVVVPNKNKTTWEQAMIKYLEIKE